MHRVCRSSGMRGLAAAAIMASAIIPLYHARAAMPAAPAQAGVGPPPITAIPPSEHLTPAARILVRQIIKLGQLPLNMLTPLQARQLPGNPDWLNADLAARHQAPADSPLQITHILIPTPAGSLVARVYTPPGPGPFPVLTYFHGGGWVIANLDTYDSSCRALAMLAGYVVVSVAYRQAPEHPFPAAANDAYASSQWVMRHVGELHGIPGRVAIGGESAGGNLAAVASLMARDRHGLMPDYQLLVYPITNDNFNTPSYQQNQMTIPLNKPLMEWFWRYYAPAAAQRNNPYASPLKDRNLRGLPPAMVITDQNDPLRSEGRAYALRLRLAGVPVTAVNYTGVMHEFFGMGAVMPTALQAEMTAAQGLRSARPR